MIFKINKKIFAVALDYVPTFLKLKAVLVSHPSVFKPLSIDQRIKNSNIVKYNCN